MNDDFRNSSIDLELQVRLMNLVMGEASDFERDQLQALMEQRPELAAYCEHVEHLHGLLNEAAIGNLDQLSDLDKLSDGIEASTEEDDGSQPAWQLSADRRNQLLAVLDGTQDTATDAKVCLDNKKPWWRMQPRRIAEISVVVACLFVAIGLLRPSVQTSQQAPIVLGRKEFDSSVSTNWSFDPSTVQSGKVVMPTDGPFYGEYFNAQSQDYKSTERMYRSTGTPPSSGNSIDGFPSGSFAVQETVVSPIPSILFDDSGAKLPDIDQRFSTTNRGREMFLAEGEPASPSNASGPVASGKTSGGAGASSDDFGSQVLAERELVELRKSTTLDALSVSPNQPMVDLPAVQLESKNQIDDLAALGEVGAKSEAVTQLYNFSKGLGFQSNGIDATEKSVQEAARPQGDSSAGEANMLGRIAAGQAGEPGRVNINTLGGWQVDEEKNGPVDSIMAWMHVDPIAIAVLDPKRNPDPYENSPSSTEGWEETNNGAAPSSKLEAHFGNSNAPGSAPARGAIPRFQEPATGAPTPSTALGLNSIHDFERPQANQLLGDLNGQDETFGWADQSERFGNEQSLKQQSGDENSLLSNYSILEDAFKRREQSVVDALRGVDQPAVPFDGTPAPVVYPDAKTWKALSDRRKERYGQVAPNTNYFAAPSVEQQAKSPESLDEVIDPSDSPKNFLSLAPQAQSPQLNEDFIVPSDASSSSAEPRSGESIGKPISPERRLATGTAAQPRGGEVLSKGKSDAKKETVAEIPAKKSYLEASKDSAPESDLAYEYADATFERFIPAKEPPAAFRLRRSAIDDELSASSAATSTFSLHVSDVSFKLAQAALQQGQMPEASKIRIEEFVNALDYRDPLPDRQEKVSCTLEQAVHPFLMQRNLLRISMRTAIAGRTQSTPLRLTIVLDNSGSMERPDRRQAVLRAFQTLTQQLTEKDQVTLISFANTPRLLADKVPGNQGESLLQLVESLPSEGGTNIESALKLAREKAMEQRLDAAQNRIVLMTDGAVNLGDADPTSLSKMVVQLRESGIAFDAAGICSQDLNDEVLESLTRQGDGRYYLLDSPESIGEDFAAQIAGALRPSAKNVKVQVEFNPQRVGKYKLLGFEKHRLNQEDFRNDSVDAAELASAEAGVAVYQIQPIPGGSGDIGSVSVRFRDMATGQMIERRWPIVYDACTNRFDAASPTIRLAGTAAMLATKFAGGAQADQVDLAQLKNFIAALPEVLASHPRTQQLRTMIDQARQIAGE